MLTDFEMIIRALAPWFGGKRTLAKDIVVQLGKHSQYFEPFCGSMAVFFAKDPCQKETLNDLHGDLINLALVIQSETLAYRLYERSFRTLFCETILKDAQQILIQDFDFQEREPEKMLERAYWYFVACWMGRNGTAGTKRVDYQLALRWTKNGGSPTVRWDNVVKSIPAWHQRIKRAVITNRDAFGILTRFEDCKETAIYVDSPYHTGSRTGHDKHGNSAYLHEFDHGQDHSFVAGMFPDVCSKCGKPIEEHTCDHKRLADLLNQYKHARIVVSHYDHPRIRELYEGWNFIEKTMSKQLHAANGRGARKQVAPEVLIVNGPVL